MLPQARPEATPADLGRGPHRAGAPPRRPPLGDAWHPIGLRGPAGLAPDELAEKMARHPDARHARPDAILRRSEWPSGARSTSGRPRSKTPGGGAASPERAHPTRWSRTSAPTSRLASTRSSSTSRSPIRRAMVTLMRRVAREAAAAPRPSRRHRAPDDRRPTRSPRRAGWRAWRRSTRRDTRTWCRSCYATDGHAYYSPLDAKPKKNPFDRLKRVRNIRANPRVALLIDHYEEDWAPAPLRHGAGPGRAPRRRDGVARRPGSCSRRSIRSTARLPAPARGTGHQDRPRPRGRLEPRLVSASRRSAGASRPLSSGSGAGRPLGRADGVALIDAGARRAAGRPRGGRRPPRSRQGPDGHLLAEGVPAADEPLPGRLRLLHLQARSGPAGRPHDGAGRGARRLRGRGAARLQGGAPLARRQARGALPRAPRVAPPPRLPDDHGLRRGGVSRHRDGDRTPAPRESRAHERARSPGAPRLERQRGAHARDLVRPAGRPRRPPRAGAGQAAGAPAPDDRGGRPGRHRVHDRHPLRDRRDAGRARRHAPGDPGAPRALRARPGGDRPELPGEAPHPDGAARPSRRWTTCAGRWRSPASCSGRT